MAGDAPTIADRDNARALTEGVARRVGMIAFRLRLDAADMTLPALRRCEGVAIRLVRSPLAPLLPSEDAD